MVNFGLLTAEICWRVLRTPANFNGFRVLPRKAILPRAFHPSLAFSYISSVTARHSSSGRQRKFVASYTEWNYGTFAEGATYIRLSGHHVGIGPHSISQRSEIGCLPYFDT